MQESEKNNLFIITDPCYRILMLSSLLYTSNYEQTVESLNNFSGLAYIGFMQKPVTLHIGNYNIKEYNVSCNLKFDFQNGNTGKISKIFLEILEKTILEVRSKLDNTNICSIPNIITFMETFKVNLSYYGAVTDEDNNNQLYTEYVLSEKMIVSTMLSKNYMIWHKDSTDNKLDVMLLDKLLSGEDDIINGLYRYFILTISCGIFKISQKYNMDFYIKSNTASMDVCCAVEYGSYATVMDFICDLGKNRLYYELLKEIDLYIPDYIYQNNSFLKKLLKSFNINTMYDGNNEIVIYIANHFIFDRINLKNIRNTDYILSIRSTHFNKAVNDNIDKLLSSCNSKNLVDLTLNDRDNVLWLYTMTVLLGFDDINEYIENYTDYMNIQDFIVAFTEMLNDMMISDMSCFMGKVYSLEVECDERIDFIEEVFNLSNNINVYYSDDGTLDINKLPKLDLDNRNYLSMQNLSIEPRHDLEQEYVANNVIYSKLRRFVMYLLSFGLSNMGGYNIDSISFNQGNSGLFKVDNVNDFDDLPYFIYDKLLEKNVNIGSMLELQSRINNSMNSRNSVDVIKAIQEQISDVYSEFKQNCTDKILEDGVSNVNIKDIIGLLLHDSTNNYNSDIHNFISDKFSANNISINHILKNISKDSKEYDKLRESPEADYIGQESFCRRLDMFDIWFAMFVNCIREAIFDKPTSSKISRFESQSDFINKVLLQFK